MKTGFIGLGIMGSRMAKNLLQNGVDLAITNRTKEKGDELLAEGAAWFDTPAELAQNTTLVFTMLSTPEVVREVAFGENGFVDKMPENALWVDCSTVNPSFTREMAKKSEKAGIRFMDAPVSGSLIPAENGELVFLVGGEKKDFEQLEEMFLFMGKNAHYLGENANGTSAKMVVNAMLGQALVAFSECITLGKSLGLDRDKLFKILIGGPLTAPFVGLKKENFINNEYPTEFPLKWMHKDLFLASVSAFENNCALPSLNAGKELYGAAKASGLGDKDMSAVYQYIMEKLNYKI